MDRKEYATRLQSAVVPAGTSVEEIKKIMFPVSEAVFQMMPVSLFRYRKCDKRQINAFKMDTIYAVTADKFNDPYDTLTRYDQKEIERIVNSIVSCEALEGMKEWFAQGKDFPDEVKQILSTGMTDAIRDVLLAIDDVSVLKDNIEESRVRMINLIETLVSKEKLKRSL